MAVAKFLCVVVFLSPIAVMFAHASAVREAEIEFNKQQAEHQRIMNKMIKDYNDGRPVRVRASTVANP